jgi:hypothetical protein
LMSDTIASMARLEDVMHDPATLAAEPLLL